MQGIGFHWELWNFKLGNFTNFDVLKAGTINGARALGLDDYLGTLAPGKLADIIFYDRNDNPIIDIFNSKKVKKVVGAESVLM